MRGGGEEGRRGEGEGRRGGGEEGSRRWMKAELTSSRKKRVREEKIYSCSCKS
jgi:hypothetical protein